MDSEEAPRHLCHSLADEQPQATQFGPRYTKEGKLIRPTDYETWIFVGASLGMTYEKTPAAADKLSKFGNVYLEATAYHHYVETDTFPEMTMPSERPIVPHLDHERTGRPPFQGVESPRA